MFLARRSIEVHVHRAARAAELAGVALGAQVTPDIVARVLAHPLGGLKNVPGGARVIPLINKVEDAAALRAGRETARALLAAPQDLGGGHGRGTT